MTTTSSVLQIPAGSALTQTPNGELVLVHNPGPNTATSTVQLPPGTTIQQTANGGMVLVNSAPQVEQQQQQSQVRQRRIVGTLVDEKKPEPVQLTLITTETPAATATSGVQVKVPVGPRYTAKSIMQPDESEVLKIMSKKEGEFEHSFQVFHLDMQASFTSGEMVYDVDNIHTFNLGKTWLEFIQSRASYKLPCPWPLMMFTNAPRSMDILFPLSKPHSRIADVMDSSKTELLRTVSLKELSAVDPAIDATRTDAHMLIYDATLKGYTTDGIDVALNTHLYSWLDNGGSNGVLRPLKHTVGRKLLVPSFDGQPLHAQCVMLPNTRAAFTKEIDDEHMQQYHRRLYEMPDDVLDDPWISRGLTVNFGLLRAELNKPISEGGYASPFAGFLKVKGPPPPQQGASGPQNVAAVMQNLNIVQWLILNQFEYVLQESEAEIEKLPNDHKLAGAPVVQHNSAQTEFYFYVHVRPIIEIIDEWERRVRQSHVLSNCTLLAVAAIPLDHKAIGESYALKMSMIERERDRIDTNPFVNCWAKVHIRYWPFRGDKISQPHTSKFSEEERRHMIGVVPALSGIGIRQAALSAAQTAAEEKPDVSGKSRMAAK